MKTDTSEKGLEKLIVDDMTSAGWIPGNPGDYDRSYAVDLVQLRGFITETQPNLVEALDLQNDSPARQKFLARLQGEITKRGVIDVLRKGIKHGQHNVDLFYGTPSEGNAKAAERFAQNRFSVTRQLRYSLTDDKNALDLGLFINGLPIATFELKNNLTKQTVADAIEQYKKDRDPRELIFQFGRCMAHFAVDDAEVRFCTDLKGKWFLPFNKGWNDGAGNPPNPDGLKTDYLWKDILTKYGPDRHHRELRPDRRGEKQENREGHQEADIPALPSTRCGAQATGAHTSEHGVGNRYLIEHSAGSGKSNSIAWLAHQLTSVKRDGKEVFDTIIVVTDRTILDDQIKGTIKQFDHVGATVGPCGSFRGFAPLHRAGEEDRHFDGAEVSVHH